ncbi:MAG: hypothetical protein ACFFCW_06850 [Candidatus Hodarchaeota archaeon]
MSTVNVFITVDTEHSIGGAFKDPSLKPVGNEKRVYGKIGGTFYGIPLIIDIADHYGIPLTFFVEIFNKYHFGNDESKEVCEYILKRNHDVQLHLHPNYLNFTLSEPHQMRYSDLMGNYSLSKQVEFIKESKETLLHFGVPPPIAFRAGCFGANVATLRALRKTGFLIDSSYNTSYLGDSCLLPDMNINDLVSIENIWEFPITNFIEHIPFLKPRPRPLDINGVSFEEMHFILQRTGTEGPHNITIILHSFSFIKPFDAQYVKARPRTHVMRRFEKLCEFLSDNRSNYHVRTFGSLNEQKLINMRKQAVQTLSKVPLMLCLMRGFTQLKDKATDFPLHRNRAKFRGRKDRNSSN